MNSKNVICYIGERACLVTNYGSIHESKIKDDEQQQKSMLEPELTATVYF